MYHARKLLPPMKGSLMTIKLVLVSCVFALLCDCNKAAGAEIWLGGVDPYVRGAMDPHSVSDYMDLFKPTAAWETASRAVKVFKTSTQFLANASDDTLTIMFSELARRNIALGMEALMLTRSAKCGSGIEGYTAPGNIAAIADRVKKLGGDLRYVAMDEPLDFGHYSNQPNACHASLAELAADIRNQVHSIRQVFPDVLIGDIEVIGRSEAPGDVDALMEWVKVYESVVGMRLSFLHLDVLWTGPWRSQITTLLARLRSAGISSGIIYNGDSDDQTGLAWTRHAEQRFSAIEATPGPIPDHAVLQTWMLYPDRMLPESQPGTMTWLVNRYLAAESRLEIKLVGDRLEGRLGGTGGGPVAGAQVMISARSSGESGPPVLHSRSGLVPPKAVAALYALRINAECVCSGTVDAAIGPMEYRNDRTGDKVQKAFRRTATTDTDSMMIRFRAQPGQPIAQNTSGFPVVTGDPFTIRVPMRINADSGSSGYTALIFVDAKGKEVERLKLTLDPAEHSVGTAVTDGLGRFSLMPEAPSLSGAGGFKADFLGDGGHRAASATLR
jgi:hypothetical protein